ncbi:hypothetical protein FRB99_004745 [Tulasnella sp. 403]|nr:hypothetical protein FRB99_004745 [Tulasnella sp. 403]
MSNIQDTTMLDVLSTSSRSTSREPTDVVMNEPTTSTTQIDLASPGRVRHGTLHSAKKRTLATVEAEDSSGGTVPTPPSNAIPVGKQPPPPQKAVSKGKSMKGVSEKAPTKGKGVKSTSANAKQPSEKTEKNKQFVKEVTPEDINDPESQPGPSLSAETTAKTRNRLTEFGKLESDFAKLESDYEKLVLNVFRHKKQIQLLQGYITRLKGRHELRHATLLTRLRALHDSFERLEASSNQAWNSYVDEKNNLMNRIEIITEESNKRHALLEGTSQRLQSAEQDVVNRDGQIAMLQSEHHALQHHLSVMEATAQSEKTLRETNESEATSRVQELSQAVDSLQGWISELEEGKKTADELLRNSEQSLRESLEKEEASQMTIQELRTNLTASRAVMDIMRAEKERARETSVTLKRELEELKGLNETLEALAATTQMTLSQRTAELEASQRQVSRLNSLLESSSEKMATEMTGKTIETNAANDRLRSALSDIASLRDQLRASQEVKSSLNTELSTIRATVSAEKVKQMEEVREVQNLVQQLKLEIESERS